MRTSGAFRGTDALMRKSVFAMPRSGKEGPSGNLENNKSGIECMLLSYCASRRRSSGGSIAYATVHPDSTLSKRIRPSAASSEVTTSVAIPAYWQALL
jgi:hypothetical protein